MIKEIIDYPFSSVHVLLFRQQKTSSGFTPIVKCKKKNESTNFTYFELAKSLKAQEDYASITIKEKGSFL